MTEKIETGSAAGKLVIHVSVAQAEFECGLIQKRIPEVQFEIRSICPCVIANPGAEPPLPRSFRAIVTAIVLQG